jgi:DNA-binding protein YbaB
MKEPSVKTVKSGAQPDGRKGILIRVNPKGWRELRDLAAELTLASGQQVTMQSLITDAINDTLKRHKRAPLA